MRAPRSVAAVTGIAVAAFGAVVGQGQQSAAAAPADELVYATDAELRVLDLATGVDTALTANGIDVSHPSLSPDRTKIAFCQESGAFDCSIYVHDRVAGTTRALPGGAAGADQELEPEWSPDGARLLTSEPVRFAEGARALYTRPATGGVRRRVPNSIGALQPSWAPGGRHIAFTELRPRPDGTARPVIGVLATDGSGRASLGLVGHDPAWSPDGARIAYVADVAASDGSLASSVVVTVNARGGSRRVLESTFHAGAQIGRPAWRSDGRTLYYAVRPARGDAYLESADAAGTTRARLSTAAELPPDATAYAGPLPPPDRAAPSPLAPTLTLAAERVTATWAGPREADAVAVQLAVSPGTTPPATFAAGRFRTTVLGAARRAVVPGLATGAVHSYALWVVDPSGNSSPVTTGRFRTTAPPRLTAPPTSALASTALPFPVSWSPVGPGARRVEVQWREQYVTGNTGSTGAWATWRATAGAGRAAFGAAERPTSVRQSRNYLLRAVALDEFGNRAFGAPSRVAVPLDDRALTRYSGGWTRTSASGSWLGTLTTTRSAAAVTVTADVSSFRVVGERHPRGGHTRVYVDGVLRATISSYARTRAPRQLLWSSGTLDRRTSTHTLRLVNVPDPRSARDALHLDGISWVPWFV
ncbi:PD40 domain-containing protein [Motilibacter deserti]|uniref:WD40 repeat protein n=1 Tax=Motilibacter deserti TaxID=2714956 RepID=A0ABX0GX82_9ACTN|nr:PD40 domain-containing protein [Motilibacter deserti]NHC14207.1 hypothetical protein [Motilibacter deserti]